MHQIKRFVSNRPLQTYVGVIISLFLMYYLFYKSFFIPTSLYEKSMQFAVVHARRWSIIYPATTSDNCLSPINNRSVKNGLTPPNMTSYAWALENIYKPFNYSLSDECVTQPWLSLVKHGQKDPKFCENIFTSWIERNKGKPEKPPAKWPTEHMMPEYTMNNSIQLSRYYFNNIAANAQLFWNKKHLDNLINSAKTKLPTGYGKDSLMVYEAISALNLTGKRTAVIGTIRPWVEATLLLANVSQVTTIEYSKIKIVEEPKMTSLLPLEAAQRTLNGTLEPFDFVGSFSSIEHSGLGRFGDVLDPNGDLMEMLKCWCWLKPGGYMLFGVPAALDHIRFNAHRIYGPLRLPLMTAGFEIVSVFSPDGVKSWHELKNDQWIFEMPPGTPINQHYQRVIILRKKDLT